jgi:hypothetical protein
MGNTFQPAGDSRGSGPGRGLARALTVNRQGRENRIGVLNQIGRFVGKIMKPREHARVAVSIEAYDRETEFIAMELKIAPIDLIELRRLAGFPDDFDNAVAGILVEDRHREKILEWVKQVLDIERFHVDFSEARLPKDYE